MPAYQKKYIITGAPGTGKTTLLEDLKKDYICMDEVSRRIILNQQRAGGDAMPWQNVERFASMAYKASLDEIKSHPKALFCDRSMLDLIAYLSVADKQIPDYLTSFPYHDHFHSIVFFAPLWKAIYRKDDQRQQEFDYCALLERELIKVYEKWGFRIVSLPKTTSLKRSGLAKKIIRKKQYSCLGV